MDSRAVLITGGSSGIGAAAVRAFAEQGDHVWFTYHRGRARAEELAHSLPNVSAFPLDLGSTEDCDRLLATFPTPVDVLVNNAAVGSATVEVDDMASRAQNELFAKVNFLGPLHLSRSLLPGMIARGSGKILMVGSVGGGITAFPGFRDADGMAKAALTFLTKKLAAELCHFPVDVFCICPGAVDTPMFHQSTLDRLPAEEAANLISRLPGGRLIRPEEIAEVLRWLASPAAAVLHGAVLDASMGLSVRPDLLVTHAAD